LLVYLGHPALVPYSKSKHNDIMTA
jgi:hypothetical protein